MLHFVENQVPYGHSGKWDVHADRSQGDQESQVPAGDSVYTEVPPSE